MSAGAYNKQMLFQQCDFHIHSYLSPCAHDEMQLPAILDICAQRGIKYLGINDHIFEYTNPEILDITREHIMSIDKPMQTFVGCEAEILDVGVHTVTENMKATLDYISVSANHFHRKAVASPESNSNPNVAKHFLKMFSYACTLDFVDVIVHPMYVMPGTYNPAALELLTNEELMEPLTQAKQNNVAMEISLRVLKPQNAPFLMRFYSLCKEVGIKFSFGSDAHWLENAGQTQKLNSIVDKLGITDADVWLPKSAKKG